MKLNDEQRKLVEDHQNLIVYVCQMFGLDFEEYYGELACGLCKAAYTFAEGKGCKFSTYAITVMRREVALVCAHNTRKKRYSEYRPTSLNAPVKGVFEGREPLLVGDTLESDFSMEQVVENILVTDFLSKLKERDRKWMIWRMQGKTLREIAAIEGISYQRVQAKMKWLGEKVRKEFEV